MTPPQSGTSAQTPLATFVSAADQRFCRCIHQLLRSAKRRGYVKNFHWIVYDMGIDQAERRTLEQKFPWCEFRALDLEGLPGHCNPSQGTYAWKPHVIWEVLQQISHPLCWLDSATVIKGDLSPMLSSIRKTGLYLLFGQTAMLNRCDPGVMLSLDFPRALWGSRECSAGVIGFDPNNLTAMQVASDWCRYSKRLELIQPSVINCERHMHDQAILSCLILPLHHSGEVALTEEDVDISSANPIRFLSTRNKVSSAMPCWMDPLVRACYAIWKFIDQFAHRIDNWHGRTKIIYRWLNEYWNVYIVGHDGSKERLVPCPIGHYYADPFLWEDNGATWIFVEDLSYLQRRGYISAIPVNQGKAGKAIRVLDTQCHASFPYLFRYRDGLFMLPETCANNGIDLYECERFPDRWVKCRRLIDKVDAADSIVFPHNDRWWLITSQRSPGSGGFYQYLSIYYTDDPLNGIWQAHPINDQALYIENGHGDGRNAGPLVKLGSRLLRPVQRSKNFYGEGMAFMEIVELTPNSFREEPITPPPGLTDIVGRTGVHHVSQSSEYVAYDQRIRGIQS